MIETKYTKKQQIKFLQYASIILAFSFLTCDI